MSVQIFTDTAALVQAAAEQIVRSARTAVAKRGRFLLALSGGNSPRPLYRLLADPPYREDLPWAQTFVFWSDERYVPIGDQRSNAGMARELLLKHVPVPADHVHTVYLADSSPEQAAAEYEAALRKLNDGADPRLDLVLLGCGTDGHTASLFPHSPALAETDLLVRAVQPEGSDIARVTMTPRLLNQSCHVIFIVYGESKSEVVHRVLEGPSDPDTLPAQVVRPVDGETIWMLDTGAASKLSTAVSN